MSEGNVNSMKETIEQRIANLEFADIIELGDPDHLHELDDDGNWINQDDFDTDLQIAVSMPRKGWVDLISLLKQLPPSEMRDSLWLFIHKSVKHHDHPLMKAMVKGLHHDSKMEGDEFGFNMANQFGPEDFREGYTKENIEKTVESDPVFHVTTSVGRSLRSTGVSPARFLKMVEEYKDLDKL